MDRILGFDLAFLIDMGIMLFNILFMVFIMYKLLYKPVLSFLEKREEKIGKQLTDAAKAQKEAAKFKIEYEQKLSQIEKERIEILDSAHKRAKEKESQIIITAKNEAEIVKNRALLDIDREQEKAKDSMRKEIIEISGLIAERFVAKTIDTETQNRLLEEVIGGLGDVKWQN